MPEPVLWRQPDTVAPTQHLPEAAGGLGWKTKLGIFASTLLCSAAIGGSLAAPAAATEAAPVAGGVQGAVTVEAAPGISPASGFECGDPSFDAPRRVQIASMLCRFNAVRSVQLVEDPVLDRVAQEKLDDIVDCGDDFSHFACGREPFFHFPPLKAPWARGEILARGVKKLGAAVKDYAVLGTVHGVFGGWHKSPEHWPLINNETYTNVGIAFKRVKSAMVYDVPWKNVVFWSAEFLGP